MNSPGDDDYDMPLLVRNGSESPRSESSWGFSNSSKSADSNDMNLNIAAVSDDFEALSFLETNKVDSSNKADSDVTSNTSRSSSPVPELKFPAQFDPDVADIIDEKSESGKATVFDDDTSNDLSVYSSNEEIEEEDKSLKPPSIVADDEKEAKDSVTKSVTTKSSTNSTCKNSRSNADSDNPRASSSKLNESYYNETADEASWNADDIDDFVDAASFGNNSSGLPIMQISGVDLLTERDNSVNELQEVHHLMTFNSLVLIQKQKDWIEGSIAAQKGKPQRSLLTMELENLERKIKLLMDVKAWPNDRERRKQEKNPLTPSRAFFKAMALIDKSIEQFHKQYLKHISTVSEDNHELKIRIDKLVELNKALQEEASKSRQKTAKIKILQQERKDLKQTVDATDQMLASLLVNAKQEGSPIKRESSNLQSVKTYIQKLEEEREAHLSEIQSLKTPVQGPTESNSETDDSENDTKEVVTAQSSDEGSESNVVTGVLDDDLGSKWNTMERNEIELSSKDDRISSLTATVTGQESALEQVRAECKLMKSQLLQLEISRNEFKSQCDMKDSALTVSQDRISSLEEEILKAHAQCAAHEEDYEALRESFSTQKVATKQEITNSQDEVKGQVDLIREEFKEKLRKSEEELRKFKEDQERVVRDLKKSVEEMETERNQLRATLSSNTVFYDSVEEEKKECDNDFANVALTPADANLELMQSRFVEKASKQAFTIAQLTEENEMKDEQLKSLQEMVEMLLGQRNGEGDPIDKRKWGQRLSNLRARSQQAASDLVNRSQHGSMHGGQ